MTAEVINQPAVMHVETARCLFAIELSKQSWVIGFIRPFSSKISRRVLSGGDWKGLLKLIEEVQTRASRETGRTVEVVRRSPPLSSVSSTGHSNHILIRCSTRRSTMRRASDFSKSAWGIDPKEASTHYPSPR